MLNAKQLLDETDLGNLSTAEFSFHSQLHLTMISFLLARQLLSLFHTSNFHHCSFPMPQAVTVCNMFIYFIIQSQAQVSKYFISYT